MPTMSVRQALLSALSVMATLAAVSMVAAAIAGGSHRAALLSVRPGTVLWDDVPLSYEESFGVENENLDGTEFPTMFNAADADGASWRQYVPLVVWPDKDWFDEEGHYIGRSGGMDQRKTTVTKQLPLGAFASPQLKTFGEPMRARVGQLRLARSF